MRYFRLSITAVACLTLFAVACTDSETHWGDNDNQQQNQGSNDVNGGDNDNHGLNGNGDNDTEPQGLYGPSVTFDDTEVGEETTTSVELVNYADEAIEIDAATVDGSPFSFAPDFDQWPAEMEPDDAFEVEVTYAPGDIEVHNGQLVVDWYDGNEHSLEMELVGNQVCIEADPTTLDFGDVDVGQSATETTTVINCGIPTYDLHAEIAYASSVPEPEPFSIIGDDVPVELQADESVDITVEFSFQDDYDELLAYLMLEAEPDFDRSLSVTLNNPIGQNANDSEEVNDDNAEEGDNDWEDTNGEDNDSEEQNGEYIPDDDD